MISIYIRQRALGVRAQKWILWTQLLPENDTLYNHSFLKRKWHFNTLKMVLISELKKKNLNASLQ